MYRGTEGFTEPQPLGAPTHGSSSGLWSRERTCLPSHWYWTGGYQRGTSWEQGGVWSGGRQSYSEASDALGKRRRVIRIEALNHRYDLFSTADKDFQGQNTTKIDQMSKMKNCSREVYTRYSFLSKEPATISLSRVVPLYSQSQYYIPKCYTTDI